MAQITRQVYMGREVVEFDKGLHFHSGAIGEAAGASERVCFIRVEDDCRSGRLYNCKGTDVTVVAWDHGNGWMSVNGVEGSDDAVARFWRELERICGEKVCAA